MTPRLASVFFTLGMLGAGCGPGLQAEITVTAPPSPVTPTSSPAVTLAPSPTAPPALEAPTTAPVAGLTTTRINVRGDPSTVGSVLGILPAGAQIEITGQEPGGTWLEIHYPESPEGRGWVAAQYVTTGDLSSVPVKGPGQTGADGGSMAVIRQQLNVRSGPGTGFNSLGTLNEGDAVSLTGKDSTGAWLQIAFAAGPGGRGWMNAAFVQAEGMEDLPIVAESGQVIGTETPTGIPPSPTPTRLPAWEDRDSTSRPIAGVVFEPAGTQALLYYGDVSSPQGDAEDWIAFRPDRRPIVVSLACSGNGLLEAEILDEGVALRMPLRCGDQEKPLAVRAGANYLIHVQAVPSAAELHYAAYTLKLETRP